MVETTIAQLAIDPQSQTPIVVLKEKDGKRVLPIYIGRTEANAIAMELAQKKFDRPLTHDLLQRVIVGLDARLDRVVISRVEDSTYFAELQLRREDHVIQIDARPSDSIAVALRLKAPVFVNVALLEEEGVAGQGVIAADAPMDSDALKQYLEKLDPEDFGKFNP